jgi:hypothetical protein
MAEHEVVELARHARLPFTVTGPGGLHVHGHDLAEAASREADHATLRPQNGNLF